MTKPRNGFTLIELLIVIALLGTAIALVLPIYEDLTPEGKIATTQTNLGTLRSAVTLYAGKIGKFPNDLDLLISEGFLKKIPKEMIIGSDDVTVDPRKRPSFKGGWVYFSDMGEVKVNVNQKGLREIVPKTHVDPYNDW